MADTSRCLLCGAQHTNRRWAMRLAQNIVDRTEAMEGLYTTATTADTIYFNLNDTTTVTTTPPTPPPSTPGICTECRDRWVEAVENSEYYDFDEDEVYRATMGFCPECDVLFNMPSEWYGNIHAGQTNDPTAYIPVVPCTYHSHMDEIGDRPGKICSHPGCDRMVMYSVRQRAVPYGRKGKMFCRSHFAAVVQCNGCKDVIHIEERGVVRQDGLMWNIHGDPINGTYTCGSCYENATPPAWLPFTHPNQWEFDAYCTCRTCRWLKDNGERKFPDWLKPEASEYAPSMCYCGECGNMVPDDLTVEMESLDDSYDYHTTYLCHSCREIGGQCYCGHCDDTIVSGRVVDLVNGFCSYCAEDQGWWQCHEGCGGRWYSPDEDCNCDGVHAWNYVPDFIYYKMPEDSSVEPFIGWELEVEAVKGESSRRLGGTHIRDHYSWCYAMHDGTLADRGQGGLEIVSHPMTYRWIRTNWDEIEGLLKWFSDKGFRAWETKRCGMHVHIDRRHMSDAHQMRFINFIYGSANLCMVIGQRGYRDPYLRKYAPFDREQRHQFIEKVRNNHNPGVDGHYAALNADTAATLEARWFRGTLNPVSFRKNIEFVRSVWEFTKTYGHASSNEINYVSWLNESMQYTRFGNVREYIESNYITRR